MSTDTKPISGTYQLEIGGVLSEPIPFEYAEVSNLKAHIQTLQGRIEALERAHSAERELHLKIRRAIGQLAAAVGLMAK